MKRFNINSYVYVKLNNKGEHFLKQYFRERSNETGIELEYKVKTVNGYHQFQMWEFINIFSEHMNMGHYPVIEGNNFYFEEGDLITD